MKVLYVVEEYLDERARWHRGLFRHLRRWGVEIEVLNLNRSPAFRESVEEHVEAVRELGASGDYWKALPAVREHLDRVDPDLVHAVELIPAFYGALARWLLPRPRPPLVYGRHHLDTRGWSWGIMDRIAFAGSALVVAVSERAREVTLSEHPTASADRVTVIHNGIGLSGKGWEETERPRSLGGDRGVFTVLLLARLRPEKGHDVALDAAERLRSEGREIRWVFAGDGPLAAELDGRIDRRGLHGVVERTGWVDDVRSLLRRTDVLVVPSRWESFGMVAVEAMAIGVPVVASSVGGLPEVVAEDETGLLVPPGDAGALASAVAALMDDPQRARSLGRAGRERYRRCFTPEVMARAHLREYRTLVRSTAEND